MSSINKCKHGHDEDTNITKCKQNAPAFIQKLTEPSARTWSPQVFARSERTCLGGMLAWGPKSSLICLPKAAASGLPSKQAAETFHAWQQLHRGYK